MMDCTGWPEAIAVSVGAISIFSFLGFVAWITSKENVDIAHNQYLFNEMKDHPGQWTIGCPKCSKKESP